MRYRADITAGALKVPESRIIADLLLRHLDGTAWNDALYDQNGVPGVSAGKFTMGLLSPRDDVKRQSVEILAQVVLTTNDATRYCSY
jgi:hypothetical protein